MAAELEKRQIGEQFRVVDQARVPLQPISPVRIQINAIGAGAGLFFGLLLVVGFELLDTSFRTRNDILDVLALPVLARVPRLESGTEIHRRARRKLMLSAAVAVIVSAGGYAFWAMRLWKFVV